jgi:predicted DNA-binding ribbon-helix-helix protein
MPSQALLRADDLPRRGWTGRRPSTLVSRNVTVDGHRTSVRLERAMWDALNYVCHSEGKSLHAVVSEIARRQMESSLTAAIRVYLMMYFRAAAMSQGRRAGR